jgi:DNA polymerase I-like protein with 3'-5' exonuclease and polymerase domains
MGHKAGLMVKKPTQNYSSSFQLTMFEPKSDWKPTPISELPSWRGAKRIAIDCETKDEHLKKLGPGPRRGGYITGISFSIEGHRSYYIPIRHEGGDNLPYDECLAYFRGEAKHFSGEYVGANLSYDLDYLWSAGIVSPEVEYYRDVQIADPLIYELHDSFSLANIGKRFGVESKNDALLIEAANSYNVDPKAGMWRLPARFVGAYAETDASSPLKIYAEQRKKLDEDNLWRVFDLESQVLPVLVKMRQRGVRIDMEKLAEVERWTREEERKCFDIIKRDTGFDISSEEVWKSERLAPPLHAIGLKLERTPKGKWSVDQVALDRSNHPVAKAIARARKVNKLRTTFCESIRTYQVNDRIHCTFNQIARETEGGDQKGARYGRLSATDPNLQQQPSRDDFANFWRSIYIPEDGSTWGCLDFSQQEPRWTTHFSAYMRLERAEEAAARYRNDITTDNHTMMTRLIHGDAACDAADAATFKKWRTDAKIVFLGLCYGEGGFKLCQDLGLPTRYSYSYGPYGRKIVEYFSTYMEAYSAKMDNGNAGWVSECAGEEGQSIIDQFKENVPYIPKLAELVSDTAKRRGYITTIMGRRLHFPKRDDGSYDWAHKALNRLIQGSSADQTKYALVELDKAGYYLQLQVHDEMDGSFESKEQAQEAGKLMAECIYDIMKPMVPFLVDVETGPSWGQIK